MNVKPILFCAVSLAFATTAVVATPACSDDASTPLAVTPGTSTLGVVAGAADSHCGTNVVTVDETKCHAAPIDDSTDGGADGGAVADEDFPPTMFNAEGDDDDCKYHVKWAVDNVAQSKNSTFTLAATSKAGGAPLHGATISAEVFLNDTHPAPNSNQASTESSTPGTYSVGPIVFDASGQWTVRFHFNEDCNDSEQSPHGHAAFFVSVP